MSTINRFRKARLSVALSQGELARKIGCNATTVMHWETGDCFPRPAYLRRFATITGVSILWLHGLEEDFQWLRPEAETPPPKQKKEQ